MFPPTTDPASLKTWGEFAMAAVTVAFGLAFFVALAACLVTGTGWPLLIWLGFGMATVVVTAVVLLIVHIVQEGTPS